MKTAALIAYILLAPPAVIAVAALVAHRTGHLVVED